MFGFVAQLGLVDQQPIVNKFFTIDPVLSAWLLIPGLLLVGVLTFYLYRAQRQIASPSLVSVLTAIRLALIVLMFALLLRPLWVWRHSQKLPGTLWLVVDQSLSMGQVDRQSTPIERLRWADAMGRIPVALHRPTLDRTAAKLTALHDMLLDFKRQTENASASLESHDEQTAFVQSLQQWQAELSDVIRSLSPPAAFASDQTQAIAKTLEEVQRAGQRGIELAAARTSPAQAARDLDWSHMATLLETAAARLRPLADSADQRFLDAHANDPQVKNAVEQVGGMSRAQLAYAMLQREGAPSSLSQAFEQHETRLLSFGSAPRAVSSEKQADFASNLKKAMAPADSATDIGSALQFANDQIADGEPASVVLISDGRSNSGLDPAEAARRLSARGVPVYTLALGSSALAPDAAVESIDAPDWIYKDDTLSVSALVRLDALKGQPVLVQFYRGDALVDSQNISAGSDQAVQILNFKDRPPAPGVFDYRVTILPAPGEAVADNNSQSFRLSVKKDKFQALIVEDQPRWEYRYLANYLSRDNRVHLQTVLLEPARVDKIEPPAPVKASPLNEMEAAQILPATAAEWSAFDLIVIGDVPPEYLSSAAQEQIAEAVKNRGATLVVIAGPLNMPGRYTTSPLAQLLPVQLSSNWSAGALADHLTRGFRPMLAPEGAASVLGQLGLDESSNAQLWAALPDWYWHSQQTQAKASASVLWEIPGQSESDGSLSGTRQRALLSTMPLGLGRVMYLASDSTWRLRQVGGKNLHERFWGQVVSWAAGSDMPAGGKFVRFGVSPSHVLAGQAARVTARILGHDYSPLTGRKIKVIARSTDAALKAVEAELEDSPQTPGLYHATLPDMPAGTFDVSLTGDNMEDLLNGDPSATQKTLRLDVQSQANVEHQNIYPDRAALARLAHEGGGIALDMQYGDELASHLPNRHRELTSVQQFGMFADPEGRYTRMAHWSFLALFVTLISAEWLLRKAGGLV